MFEPAERAQTLGHEATLVARLSLGCGHVQIDADDRTERKDKTSDQQAADDMKNVVFWYIKTQFVLHRRHTTSPLQSPASQCYVRFEVFTAVTMEKAVFWDIIAQFLPHRRHIMSLLQSPAS
jgi:hypothetical protein